MAGRLLVVLVVAQHLQLAVQHLHPEATVSATSVGGATPPSRGSYLIDDTEALGMQWQGVGAISGGGATSKLLMDYEPSVASDILDFLFKPSFGAGLNMLKVEIGGDADATQGAEPSHMHWQGDANYYRGYEWFTMKEARARNPKIGLYGLSWSWPGWLARNSTPDSAPTPPDPQVDVSHDNATADYIVAFLEGAQKHHNLSVNYIGLWNEQKSTPEYVAALRSRLAEKIPAVEIVTGPHYPGTKLVAQNCSAPGHLPWNATNWVDEEGSVADGYSARCLARTINRGYLSGCYTGLFHWHLISSFFNNMPWPRCGLVVANQPWSGAYEVTIPVWAIAHTTMFAFPGWRYLGLNRGVGFLAKGGSYVTRISQDRADFSIVIEKMGWRDSPCARPSNRSHPYYETEDEEVTLMLTGEGIKHHTFLFVWYSNLTEGALPEQIFQQRKPLEIDLRGQSVTLHVRVNEIFTLTTLNIGHKGSYPSQNTSSMKMPFPQHDDFESPRYRCFQPPKLFYDRQGAWEIDKSKHGRGQIMRQVVNSTPVCWSMCGYNGTLFSGPWSEFGPALPTSMYKAGMRIAFDVLLEDHAMLQVRLGHAYSILLNTNGSYSLNGADFQEGAIFSPGGWHHVELSGEKGWSCVAVDGVLLAAGAAAEDPAPWEPDSEFANGGWQQDPWVSWSMGPVNQGGSPSVSLSRYIFAEIDNFELERSPLKSDCFSKVPDTYV